VSIIEKSIIHFIERDKGILVLICGIGKTLISLWIAQRLNSNTILIGVPNTLLLKQWRNVICDLFHIPYLIVSGGTSVEQIIKFLKDNKKCIVITTYASAHKVYTATTSNTSFVFDIKILDEVHHLTTTNMKTETSAKTYIQILPIPSVKQLSLTATLKQLDGTCDDGHIVVSNDNIEYFGEIIDRKCLLWAINENIICDYVIQTIIAEQLPHIIGDELFLSGYSNA
jgi:superfamily II DNA or RNA helicase